MPEVAAARTVPRVVVGDTVAPAKVRTVASPDRAWSTLGWFGLLLAFVGSADILLAWYPLGFGNVAWEFGTVDRSFSNLPLLTMGFAAMLGSALALGSRWRIRTLAGVMLLMSLVFVGVYVALYLLNVPLVLQMTPSEVAIGVKKAIVKTSINALAFTGAYFLASVVALHSVRKGR